MKYWFSILVLLLFSGIALSANLLVNGTNYYVTATTNYNWTLEKNGVPTNLEFNSSVSETVLFTIDVNRSAPYTQTQLIGHIDITNTGSTPATITSIVDSIRYFDNGTWRFVHEAILFIGSYQLAPGGTWTIPMYIPFTTPYNITWPFHYNFVNVYTDDGGSFQYYDAFHALPGVVNETLHVWDEIIVPNQFSYQWDYNGPWSVHGDTTFYANLALTNQSAGPGSYQVINVASGSNECGYWADTVVIQLHVTPPDTEWHGVTFTPGYWKNHTQAFAGFLPVTIAGTTVNTVNQATSILNNPSARNAWNSFLCHFLTTVFNTRNNSSLLSAVYNNHSQTGEFMEGQTVTWIISLANNYRSNTARATLLAMKDVFDAINNNATTHVLWNSDGGGSGSNILLPTSDFINLYPNPFIKQTEIVFLTEVTEPMALKVYDLTGKKVRDLVKTINSPLIWDGSDNFGQRLTRGVYIIKLVSQLQPATIQAVIHR